MQQHKKRGILVQYFDNKKTEAMCILIEKVLELPEEVFNAFRDLLLRDKGEAKRILDQIVKERGD